MIHCSLPFFAFHSGTSTFSNPKINFCLCSGFGEERH